MNSEKIILDLCGGTGAWSRPYKEAGYDVKVITLPRHDLFKTYFFEENGKRMICFTASGYDKDEIVVPVEKIYGILAAPTCTMFSLARTTAKTPRDFHEGMALVDKCMWIIQEVRHDHKIFWALENPMGYLRQFLGRPPLTFNPNDYGDPYTKKTDLWGFYNIPKKSPVPLTDQQMRDMSINNRMLEQLPEDYVLPDNFNRQAARRSITPKGFANAFYKANK